MDKILQALEMNQAIKDGKEGFILLKKLDEIEEKIDKQKVGDIAEIIKEINKIKAELAKPIEIEVKII
jgi:hypothetical protein